MASEGAVTKRAKLVASRVHWGCTDLCESIIDQDEEIQGNSSQNSVGKWLTTTITEEDAKQEPLQEAAGPLRRNPSSDDDLDLGVEASIYGKQGVRTVQEFLRLGFQLVQPPGSKRWSSSSPALSRWNSFSSATSGHSGPLSVMDILNLWNDDPEEILLDLGFGCDEPDLSGRIPARFISYQSQARGINLQVFLEAQKNRLDLENPDVSNRFRQLEVLQQVTTAFSSLVASSSSPMQSTQGKDLPPDAQERRRRMGILFRRASKKSLGQIHNYKMQGLTIPAANSAHYPAPESQESPPSLRDKKLSLKRVKPGSLETVCLSPLAEEQGNGPDLESQPHLDLIAQKGAFKSAPLREGYPHSANAFLQRKKSQGQTRESFEMEEIYSFDESSFTGSYAGGAENLVRSLIRTNSCQSDSSGFLEEPFIPLVPHLASPGLDIIKAHSGLSERSSDSQGNKKPGSSPSSPHTDKFPVFASEMTSSVADKHLPSSPCLSPDPSLVLNPPITPASLSNYELQIANTEKAPNQDQSPPTCLPALECEYFSPCSSSSKLQKITQCQSLNLPFHSPGTSFSPTSSQVQPTSWIRGSEEIKSVDRSAPSTSPSTLSHDSQGKTSALASCCSPNVNSQVYESIAISSTQPDSFWSSCTQSERTKFSLYENPISSSGCISSMLPSSSDIPHSAISECFSPPTLVSPKLIKFISHIPENNNNLFFSPDSDGQSFSISTTGRQNEENGSVSVFSFHLGEANLSEPVSSLSCKLYIPDCQPDMSSQSNDPNNLIDPAAGEISDLTEELATKQNTTVLPQKSRQYSYNEKTVSPLACQIQNGTNVKMDDISLKTFQMNEKQQRENERHSSIVQAQEAVASLKYTETPAGLSESFTSASKEVNSQTEMDKLVTSCSLHDEISAKTKQKGTVKVCQKQVICKESESPGSYISLHDQVAETHNRAEENPNNLIEIESLDLAFETSVDGSDSENVDIDAFFQQLDTEGRVYWAEPIQLSNPTPEASGSFEASDGSSGDSFSSTRKVLPLPMSSSANTDREQTSRDATASLDVSSSLTLATSTSPSAIPNIKPSNRSVSVQMSSYLSSHIVHRKDVPYVTESKHTHLPTILPLDTSTPFRAVQSWTDLQIQRNALTKNLSFGSLHAIPSKANVSMSCPGMTHKLTHPEISSSSPSFFLLSDTWKSQETIPEMALNSETESVSVDTGLWPDEQEEEVNRTDSKSEGKLWEGSQTATRACCCSCDHHCTCCIHRSYNKESTLGNSPYSLDELEEMMLCLRQFCSVLSNMEEQLSEDQAAVYSCLSDQDREKVRDLEELRRAVKQEAGELEKQLKELAYDYDESLKMKMHRLLDEQSLLCSQLKVFLPGTVSISSSPIPNRTVATQCCLLPLLLPTDMQSSHVSDWKSWKNLKPGLGSNRQSPPGSESICEGQGSSTTKADKLNIVGFLQRVCTTLKIDHRKLRTELSQEMRKTIIDKHVKAEGVIASFCEHRLIGMRGARNAA